MDRAQEELAAHEGLITTGGEGLVFRTGWLRARIAWSRGNVEGAERLFTGTYAQARARGIPFDTGLVSLELALVHLVQGRTEEMKRLAAEALEIFAEQEVERETRAALELLEAAARRDALTRELVERSVASLQEARHGGRAPIREAS